MKKIFLILALIAIYSCQELVVESWYPSNSPITKEFRGSKWSSADQIAVYGWFKIDSKSKDSQSILVLTQKQNYEVVDYSQGSRVFSFSLAAEYNMFLLSSHIGDHPIDTSPQYIDFDKNKWLFFHFSYSFSAQKLNFYIKRADTEINKTFSAIHVPSSFYRFYIGGGGDVYYVRGVSRVAKFQGELKNFYFNSGAGAYKESGYDGLILQTNPDFAGKQCPIFYSECNYKGNAISLCEKRPISFENMKSVQMPPNYAVKIPNPKDPSKKVVFNSSVSCITSWNWTSLSEKNISHKKKQHNLKKSD